MQTVPTLRSHPAVPTALVEDRFARIARRSAAAGVDTRVLGIAPFTRRPMVFADGGADWMVMPIQADPVVASGRMAIPAVHHRRLRRLARHGVEIDELLIAHETPPGWTDGVTATPRPLTDFELERFAREAAVPVPMETDRLSRQMGAVAATAGMVAARVVTAGVAAAVAGAAAVGGMAVMLDPILIGAVGASERLREGDLAGFIVLAQWAW